jgi:hypothetical protein
MSSEPAPAPASSDAPAPAPLLFLNGQPISAEAAGATRASLLGNETYAKEALTDPEKQRHLALLWQLERGIQPPPAETIEQAQQQIGDRLERDRLMHASALHSSAEFTPEQVHQITNGRPIPKAEQEIAQRRLEVLKKDKGFVERYLAGDQQAGLEMRLASIAARGLPVAKNLAEIEAWEKAHPFSK